MQKFLLKFALSPKFTLPELTNDNHHKYLREKPLHGKFFCQKEEILQVDIAQSHQWLYQVQLHPETEATICADQEQTMVTTYIQKELLSRMSTPSAACVVRKTKQYCILLVGVKCSLAPGTPSETIRYASTYIGVSSRITMLLQALTGKSTSQNQQYSSPTSCW
eukprot:15345814-Ditylum_brightwellii.AAC.1